MILLNDKKIRSAMGFAMAWAADYDSEGKPIPERQVAKAQLKEVVRLLKACDGELISHREKPFVVTFEMLAEDWQELLKEADDES